MDGGYGQERKIKFLLIRDGSIFFKPRNVKCYSFYAEYQYLLQQQFKGVLGNQPIYILLELI